MYTKNILFLYIFLSKHSVYLVDSKRHILWKNCWKIKKSWEPAVSSFFFSIAAIPAWTLVGAILFSTKLICVTSVCKLWWSILSVYSVKYHHPHVESIK